MGGLKDIMVAEMRLRGFAESTVRAYLFHMRRFIEARGKPLHALGPEDCLDYFRKMAAGGASGSGIRLCYSALKFFFRVMDRDEAMSLVHPPREHRRLPAVMGRAEVQALFEHCASLRNKALFALIYSAGLRISEALALKPGDLDFERKQVFVRSGKGGKDRYTLLGDRAAAFLREYIVARRPLSWLFFGSEGRERPLSKRAVQSAFKATAARAGLGKDLHVHTLRHSFATHLLEDGTNIFYIMRLLGHTSIMATLVYLHMQRLDLLGVRSPIDSPGIDLDRRAPDEDGQFFLGLAS